ncbi:MAG TPA: Ppx/GppA phosphatase family protein [Rhizomicrobium sp.]|nr:Ppx/GppA phosphatase family protein [Rhizomicrobium sp.]
MDAAIQARQKPRAPMAVLDLGTNNCRLLIAVADGRGNFKVQDSFSRIVRLGEGVEASGMISDAAMVRTIAALKICADRIRRAHAGQVRCIATQAARLASNAGTLVRRVRDETGLVLEVISAEEEAGLVALGCASLIGRKYKGALVFDIGGGSTEIIRLAREGAAGGARVTTRFAASLPLGVVTLSERRSLQDRQDYLALRAELAARFGELKLQMPDFDPASEHLLGTSGTVTTLAAIALKLPRYIRARVDASWHQTEVLATEADRLAGLSQEQLARIGSIGADRADLMLPGCALFAAICQVWPSAMLRVADRGLREGMLRQFTQGVI